MPNTAPTRRSFILGASAATALTGLSTQIAPAAQAATSDPYLPNIGDSRYNVTNYAVGDTIMTKPTGDAQLYGATTMTCKANVALTSLYIDFALNTTAVAINGVAAKVTRTNWRQLQVTGFSVAAGATFTIKVNYSDYPNARCQSYNHHGVIQNGSTITFGGQPEASIYWYPANDRIDNKATYDISVSTQATNKIVGHRNTTAYGAFKSSTGVDMVNSHCVYNKPVSSYHPGLTVGPATVQEGTWTIGGVAVPYQIAAAGATLSPLLATHTLQSAQYFTGLYGPFPFEKIGGVMLGNYPVGAIENVGCCQYRATIVTGVYGPAFIAHEIAHMWFGNAVTAKTWGDVLLLQEGLAVLLESDYSAKYSLKSSYSPTPSTLAAKSGPSALATTAAYNSGFGVMRELRKTMDGSYVQTSAPKFTAFLKAWVATYKYTNPTRAQFKALAAQHAGKDLTAFWKLYGV